MSTISTRAKGFTIVELLIVIVVIGILAVITIIAFNGIQTRAINSRLLAAVDSYEKSIRMYMTDHDGAVPLTNIDDGTLYYGVCLGDNYPAEGVFAEDVCTVINNTADQASRPRESVNAALSKYMASLPDVHDYALALESGGTVMNMRGLRYIGAPDYAVLVYHIKGDQSCGRGEKNVSDMYGYDLTECMLTIRT